LTRAAIFALLMLMAPAAGAQSVFLTGPVEWSPSLTLTDFGYDNNLFLTPKGREVEDITGTLTPAVTGGVITGRLELTSSASVDLVYFERYVEQRALNQRYAGRAAVMLNVFQPFVSAGWERVRDRTSPEVEFRALRLARLTTVGLRVFALSRASLQLSRSHSATEFEQGQVFRDVDLSQQLNRTNETTTLGFTFAVTPLTFFTATASLQRDRYPLIEGKDQQSRRGTVGIQFSPDAVINGRVAIGYSQMTVEDPAAIPFVGLTTDVDVSYMLLSVTRFNVRYGRETTASIQEPYYLQSTVGLEVQQAFLGPVELLLRLNRQILDYPGLPDRNVPAHLDHVDVYGVGFQVRFSDKSTLNTTYELSHRQSTDETLRYNRRRLTTTVSLGF
jgi:hypothetical protein